MSLADDLSSSRNDEPSASSDNRQADFDIRVNSDAAIGFLDLLAPDEADLFFSSFDDNKARSDTRRAGKRPIYALEKQRDGMNAKAAELLKPYEGQVPPADVIKEARALTDEAKRLSAKIDAEFRKLPGFEPSERPGYVCDVDSSVVAEDARAYKEAGAKHTPLVRNQLFAWMNKRQAAGAGVFVAVQRMKSRHRTVPLDFYRAIFCEDDTQRDGGPRTDWALEPSIIVESSPGKYHYYWLLEIMGSASGMTRELFHGFLERMILSHGSDPNAKDNKRVLRLPGTWNLKPGRDPHLVSVVHEPGYRYTLDELKAAFPPVEQPQAKRGPKPKWEGFKSKDKGLDRLLPWMEVIPGTDYEEWRLVGAAIHHESGGSSEGLRMWDAWSRTRDGYEEGCCTAKWADFDRWSGGNPATGGKIWKLAQEYGYREPEEAKARREKRKQDEARREQPKAKPQPDNHEGDYDERNPPPDEDYQDHPRGAQPVDDDGAGGFTEEGLALDFEHRHSDKLRYVNPWKTWHYWDGQRWREEKTLLVYDKIRELCRGAARSVDTGNEKSDAKLRAILNSAKTRSAVETISKSARRFAMDTDGFDRNDWVINTPGGIIDLKTGQNIGFDRKQYCTKITDVVPTSKGCPKWLKFLHEVTDGNKELIAYLKRCCGYWLTGSVREHVMWFIYGPGGNGKGVFTNTIAAIMAMYHVVSPAEVFAEKKQDRHPTELARLHGARLVLSQETEQGQYWAEARVKSMTGGDVIAARFMRGDFFEFQPKFKLCIVGNHKPQLRSVDDAIRRRFQLIPFDVDVKAKYGVNPNLTEELKAEYGAIMQWMVEGCMEWQAEGLNPPECVLAATADYLEGEDSVAQWLADLSHTPKTCPRVARGEREVKFETTLADLFKSWHAWADFNHIAVKNNKALADALMSRKFKKDRDRRGVFFHGIRLKTMEEQVLDGVRETQKEAF